MLQLPASVSWHETSGFCTNPMPRFIWPSCMSCMAGTVHTQHLIRAQTALSQARKKWWTVQITRRKLTSPDLSSVTVDAHLLTWDVVFQQENIFAIIASVMLCTSHSSANFHPSSTPACTGSAWYHAIRGLREKCFLASWWLVQICPKRAQSCDLMTKDVLRGQCWPGFICHALCFVFTYSMFPLFIPSFLPSIKQFGMWNSHHTAPPTKGPPPPCCYSVILCFNQPF